MFSGSWVEQDPAKKKEIIAGAAKNGREKYISRFNTMLEANRGFFVGSQLTWADIIVANSIDFCEKYFEVSITEGYPAVKKNLEAVFSAKGIKEWIEKRPVTKM